MADFKDKSISHSSSQVTAPTISLPKGGGAVRGIGEKFGANPVTGTASFSVPIATTPSRADSHPQLALKYDSGNGNGAFGFGWDLAIPAITRKTDKGLPRYQDADESDVFMLSDAEDLVPAINESPALRNGTAYTVRRYRPRVEGAWARIERWRNPASGEMHWRAISRDNVTSIYGAQPDTRIADPDDARRVFRWLLEMTYDDTGNLMLYSYKREDDKKVLNALFEENRRITANLYLKHIRYGNTTPYYAGQANLPAEFYFHILFDYSEHHLAQPRIEADTEWEPRPDPFSNYRAGFEVRTYRRCRRVLMVHALPELGATPCVVRSTDFEYGQASPIASFITSVTQRGWTRDANGIYATTAFPPLEFEYSQPQIEPQLHTVERASIENLPVGADGSSYQWVDLDGEGLSGVLNEQADHWLYKRNISNLPRDGEPITARFAPLERVADKPGTSNLRGGQQLMDLAGEGEVNLVQFAPPFAGYYDRDEQGQWEPFTPFANAPHLDLNQPNVKTIDLDGDGHSDILVSEDGILTWYPSRAKEGFGAAVHVPLPADDEGGPALLFANGDESLFLADFSGDGLTDIVRIANGEVCYWQNLGYGRFGKRIEMESAPWFDHPGEFDPKRIRLADIDGSGLTDIIYLGREDIRYWFNQSGNRWSDAHTLDYAPQNDELSTITVLDLLGNGTASLVWSSPLATDSQHPMRYVDLMGGQKPHLLVTIKNNLGAETRLFYASSTKFYLQDLYAGMPWATKLPFPVHVLERAETYDRVSRNRFVARYAYHHGYFDGVEREFRGFGMVEQWDTDEIGSIEREDVSSEFTNLDQASFTPPVHTRTWFHTGAYVRGEQLESFYREREYFKGDAQARVLADTTLPDGLTGDELREACRALKGSILRQEVYADDGALAAVPYSVSEHTYELVSVQPRGENRHAVWFTYPAETIDYHYERNAADPRVTHELTLEVDEYGNALKSASVGYGRRAAQVTLTEPRDKINQTTTHVTLTENAYTDDVVQADAYRVRRLCESRTYAVTGTGFSEDKSATIPSVLGKFNDAAPLDYQLAPDGSLQKRLIEHTRTQFRKDDLTAPLDFGKLSSKALVYESYLLAFTPALVSTVYSTRVTDALLRDDGKYIHLAGDANWWIPSGKVFYSDNAAHNPAQELDAATKHFFLPRRFRDPFENDTTITYDPHDLLVALTRDARGNETHAEHDYRVMQARAVLDPNGNRTEVLFDRQGLVTATAIMGKANETGDSLANLNPDLTDQALADFMTDPRGQAAALLGTATSRAVYDLHRFKEQGLPVYSALLAREKHVNDGGAAIHLNFSYSDGFGREIQTKIPAEAGDVQGVPTEPRWVGSGWTIFNNKGKPIKRFEPFFDTTHDFKLKLQGVSSTLFYDPLERVVATLHPNHTVEKIVFTPWEQASWDENDTVLIADPRTDEHVGAFFKRLAETEILPTWHAARINGQKGADEKAAAQKTEAHANTPSRAHLDALGRTFLTMADNGAAGKLDLRVELDIEGNTRAVRDARNRLVMEHDHDMLGVRVHQRSMEAGERWTLADVRGAPIHAWDSRGNHLRHEYDTLRRPLRLWLDQAGGASNVLVERTVYGEAHPDTAAKNLRGRVFQVYDSAGVVTHAAFDFQGDLKETTRQLLRDYKATANWSALEPLLAASPLNLIQIENAAAPLLENESFTSKIDHDALGRPIKLTAPDESIVEPLYNIANLLEQVRVTLPGDAPQLFVKDIDYDEKAQRTLIEYGNGAVTTYEYELDTFRLKHVETVRGGNKLQNLTYAYDPVGNITSLRDAGQPTIFFDNQAVDASNEYIYDAVYRLLRAQGREHIGQTNAPESSWSDDARTNQGQPFNPQALRHYTESYTYDDDGNLKEVAHTANNGDWTRTYEYDRTSALENAQKNNQLTRARVGDRVETFTYDPHGSLQQMGHLAAMTWNFKDQLSRLDLGGGGAAFYSYDSTGMRVRKVIERQNGTRFKERIYLDGFEVYREYAGNGTTIDLERKSLHVMDDTRRIALVERRTQGDDDSPATCIRYQFANQLGSAVWELDGGGTPISYEEYYPYGSTSYQAVNKSLKAGAKRYRFTGKERDEESGLYYHGARYYAPWLGRWTSADPSGLRDGPNLYVYVRNNPIRYSDNNGLWPKLIENLKNDPVGTLKRGAEVATQVAGGYAKAGLTKAAESLDPMNSPIIGLAAKAVQEVKEVKKEYHDKGGGAKGTFAATSRAFAGPVISHTVDAAFKAKEKGGGAGKIVDAGLQAMSDETNAMNPLYKIGVGVVGAPVAASEAADRGDYSEVGGQIFQGQSHFAEGVRDLIPFVAEAGLLGEAANASKAGQVSKGGMSVPRITRPLSPGTVQRMTRGVENTMRRLEIPQKNIGIKNFPGSNGRGFNPFGNTTGGNVLGRGIEVDPAVLEPIPGRTLWNKAGLTARVEATVAHEWEEFRSRATSLERRHNSALNRGPNTKLPISQQARELLKEKWFFEKK